MGPCPTLEVNATCPTIHVDHMKRRRGGSESTKAKTCCRYCESGNSSEIWLQETDAYDVCISSNPMKVTITEWDKVSMRLQLSAKTQVLPGFTGEVFTKARQCWDGHGNSIQSRAGCMTLLFYQNARGSGLQCMPRICSLAQSSPWPLPQLE